VADVERLVVHEQADHLAVGDVDDRLALLRVAVGRLGMREGTLLVERVQVRARHPVRLALVEVAAHADVAVGQREDRLGLRQSVKAELRLADAPRLHREQGPVSGDLALPLDHSTSNNSDRSDTTMSAPCSARAFACASSMRLTPTT